MRLSPLSKAFHIRRLLSWQGSDGPQPILKRTNAQASLPKLTRNLALRPTSRQTGDDQRMQSISYRTLLPLISQHLPCPRYARAGLNAAFSSSLAMALNHLSRSLTRPLSPSFKPAGAVVVQPRPMQLR